MTSSTRQWLSWIAAIGLLLFSFIYLSHIWMYLIASIILSFIGNPIVNWLSGQRIKGFTPQRSIAALVTLALLLGSFVGIFALIVPMISTQVTVLSSINPTEVYNNLELQFSELANSLETKGLWPSPEQWQQLNSKALSMLSAENIGIYFGGAINFTLDILIAVVSILFISFYMLKEDGMAGRVLRAFTPDARLAQMNAAITESRVMLSRYFTGLLIQVLVVGVLVAAGLSLLGVKYAVTLGIIASVFNLIPYIGPYIGGALGVVIALTAELAVGSELPLLPYGLKIMGVFVITQMLDNFVLQPLIFSKSVMAHPLEIFLVVLIAGSLFGIVGMLAAIPVYTLFRVVVKAFFAHTKWVQALTSSMTNSTSK
jgi:predicted PurR-regulated permease PerM